MCNNLQIGVSNGNRNYIDRHGNAFTTGVAELDKYHIFPNFSAEQISAPSRQIGIQW